MKESLDAMHEVQNDYHLCFILIDGNGIVTLHPPPSPKLRNITKNRNTLSSLVFAPLADLSLETTLDSVHRTSTTTRFARHEEDTVLLREECIKRSAGFAGYIFD